MGPSLGWALWTGAARTSENSLKTNFAEGRLAEVQ
jgi:hypothetical protein